MREFIFRYTLKDKEDASGVVVIAPLYNEKNGIMQFPIELDKWDVLGIDEWTGKCDKNDKKIFENDKVYDEYGNEGIVFLNEEECQFVIEWDNGDLDNVYSECEVAE